ncbi:uncharacterized protein sS8_3852 [Methylocaldum marinum]|uniref:DUF4166 domain-containing protein n=1 Tax=Methylocaldum marinum TaxID=1432792 RepID=A0A250KW97_9GAMM|nr:DUF4166 domain-containing protein [Methylocaldum marinum]BBA35784.1 uncharacterized protein sS8_3852 [Methylocaldum marinum]
MTVHDLPVFRRVLGEEHWARLAPAVRRHYDLSPASAEGLILQGVMEEIRHSPLIKPWLVIARWFKALVPYPGDNIPVEVRNATDPDKPDVLYWHRTFSFPDGRTTEFLSRMEPAGSGEVVEILRFGVGIRMRLAVRDGALVYTGLEHCWKVGPVMIGIPNWLLLGNAVIVESPVSDDEVRLDFEIVHPWLGRTFAYRGRFRT